LIKQFILLTQFMTRIPVPVKTEYSDRDFGKSIKYFPVLGLFIGLFLCFISFVIAKFTDNRLLTAVFIVIAETVITGGIHLDGLADTFDGLFSYRPKEKILEIMKDSRIGTNGAIVLIIYFLLKTFLLAEVDIKYIIIMPVIARIATVTNAGLGTYARKSGMSNAIMDYNSKTDIIISLFIASVICFFFAGFKGLISTAAAFVFIIYFLFYVTKKIGGVTGDTMGASLEITSILVLITGVILK
jgi:adenosylcobinamide-GDP ribazoletransferase